MMVTLGPSSISHEIISGFLRAGVSAFRVPASKYSPADATVICQTVLDLSEKIGIRPTMTVDLPGDKNRFKIQAPRSIKAGCLYRIVGDSSIALGDDLEIQALPNVSVGTYLIVGDGSGLLEVISASSAEIVVRPQADLDILRNQGVGIWNGASEHESFTASDLHYTRAIPQGVVDAYLLSFVESAESARAFSAAAGVQVIPKIESQHGIIALSSILKAFPIVLLGRGDLMLETGPVDYYKWESLALEAARQARAFVILGTELLTASSSRIVAHRSEVSYLAQLAALGHTGFMLSDETSVGVDPIRSVELLRALIDAYGPRVH